MELHPARWGRVAQLALLFTIAVRLPSLLAAESLAAMAGTLVGATLVGIVVVGLARHLVISHGETETPDTEPA